MIPGTPQSSERWFKAGVGLFLVMALLQRLGTTVADPDLWGYLAFGRLFWEGGRFPYQDVFSYVPTLKPWIYHEWLTGVLFYPIYQYLGSPGLQVLKYGLGLATVALIYLTARSRGATPLAAGFMLFIIQGFLTIGYSAVRAQVFTYFFFALTLYLLETARQQERWRRLWLLIPIQVFWGNAHGGFVAGLGLVAIYALGEALSRRPCWPYLGIFVLGGLATLINPYGLGYWSYLGRALSMPRPEITEWVSIFQAYQEGIVSRDEIIYLLSVILLAGFLILWSRWRELTPGLALLFTLYLGIRHNRHQIFFLLLVGAYLPRLLTLYLGAVKSSPPIMSLSRRLGWRLPALAGALLTLYWGYSFLSQSPLSLRTPPYPESGPGVGIYYPVGALDYIQGQGLAGKVVLDFNWGEYALWRLYPRCLVAIDGRYETVYPEKVVRPYFAFIFGRPGWRQFLEEYPPDMILIDIRSRLYALVLGEPEWRQVYADPGSALFCRAAALSRKNNRKYRK